MKVIIAPAKKMQLETDSFEFQHQPQFIQQTRQIQAVLKQKSLNELQQLWNCSDRLAQINYDELQMQDLTQMMTPAIMAYVGIQYQYMAPDLMTIDNLAYLEDHLRILSGFYGILRPFDGIVPYRLEMQAKLAIENYSNLYQFWGSQLHDELYKNNQLVINLASKEYEKVVSPYLKGKEQLVTCIFGEIMDGKVKQKATMAKMARGEMVNFMATNQVENVNQLIQFDRLGYRYQAELSDANKLVFIK